MLSVSFWKLWAQHAWWKWKQKPSVMSSSLPKQYWEIQTQLHRNPIAQARPDLTRLGWTWGGDQSVSQLPNSSSITSPDLTWTITVPPLSPALDLDNVLLAMLPICYLSTDLATPCSAAAHAARTPHSALPCSKDNHHKECNLTLVYCSLFVCTPLLHQVPSMVRHHCYRRHWLVCMYRAPSIVTLRYRDILIFYSNNFPSLNVVLIF